MKESLHKHWLSYLLVVITLLSLPFFFTTITFAQEAPEQILVKYGITFPIKELGGCGTFDACEKYCNDSAHQEACINFAKSKGFYEGEEITADKLSVLKFSKSELGCDSIASCDAFCRERINYAACEAFAQKHGLHISQIVTSPHRLDDEIIKAAKATLGCDSETSCFAFCEQEANFQKCFQFAQEQGLDAESASFELIRPATQQFLGCDSIASCTAFCMNPLNLPKCLDFARQMGFYTDTYEDYEGEESYDTSEPPEVWCSKISPECSWDGQVCSCDGPETCKQWPDCRWTGSSCDCGEVSESSFVEEPIEMWCPKAAGEGEVCLVDGDSCVCWNTEVCEESYGCKWTGSECECAASSSEEEPGEVWCPKAGESSGQVCSWDGTSCICWDPKDCEEYGGAWTGSTCDWPESTYVEEPGEVWCPKAAQAGETCSWDGNQCTCWSQSSCEESGCTWTGTSCDCTNVEYVEEPPEVWCPRTPGCTWTGSACDCSSSQESGSEEISCQEAGCTWTGTSCECPEFSPVPDVQGESTQQSFLQIILHFLGQLFPK